MLGEIGDRVESLLAAGFERIRIVTDHGWLLMPGGLPKTELPSSLTENAWGRCAAIKAGAHTDERLYPWYWNVHQEFALADGISCYRAGMEYAHGGLSLQECLTLELDVSASERKGDYNAIQISDVTWKGQRCRVVLNGEPSGLFLDLRTQAGNAATSLAKAVRPFKEDGTSSLIVEDEEVNGRAAVVVVIDGDGRLVAQQPTVVAGEDE
eukprot:TRINITY_DN26605_c0_g1_i1.p1 TRINITY_DN26605_c0_g1~~TRINITY_DN26605_c0_g1_i1.p1  ORF type:complete len:210 (+),score=29.75 TRINITY_DN26605_c0_g1_i1:314-943(+)